MVTAACHAHRQASGRATLPGLASVQEVIHPTRFVCTFWSSHLGIFSEINSIEKSPDTFSCLELSLRYTLFLTKSLNRQPTTLLTLNPISPHRY
jgi:hypothetical protein